MVLMKRFALTLALTAAAAALAAGASNGAARAGQPPVSSQPRRRRPGRPGLGAHHIHRQLDRRHPDDLHVPVAALRREARHAVRQRPARPRRHTAQVTPTSACGSRCGSPRRTRPARPPPRRARRSRSSRGSRPRTWPARAQAASSASAARSWRTSAPGREHSRSRTRSSGAAVPPTARAAPTSRARRAPPTPSRRPMSAPPIVLVRARNYSARRRQRRPPAARP